MKTNVGGIDKILRIVVGIALIAMAALGVVGAWGWIGVVPLLTGRSSAGAACSCSARCRS